VRAFAPLPRVCRRDPFDDPMYLYELKVDGQPAFAPSMPRA